MTMKKTTVYIPLYCVLETIQYEEGLSVSRQSRPTVNDDLHSFARQHGKLMTGTVPILQKKDGSGK